MACTTILIGKAASYDGSTIIARNEDSPNGQFEPKKMAVIHPEDQPRVYTSTASNFSFELPADPMRYTSVPDAIEGHGVWAAAGFNEANVAMTATETITSNERVLGADPLVEYAPARGKEGEDGYVPARRGGLGEEDFVTVVLPYIRSAREGVERLGALLETNVPVVAVSCAKGGSSILEWMPGTPFYRDALDRLKRARHFLEENGYDVEHTFLAWCQGCTDGDHKMDGNLYKEKTRTFLHAFMKEGRVETCFLIQIGNHRDHPDLYVPIQLAQKALCEEEESILLVSEQFRSFAAKGLMKDEFHYRQEAYNLVGEKAGTAAGKFAASISSRHAERSTFS